MLFSQWGHDNLKIRETSFWPADAWSVSPEPSDGKKSAEICGHLILDTVDALDGFHRDECNAGIISSFFGIVDTLERAVYNQLSSCLSQNNFLGPNQSDFRTTHSTETALLTVTESLAAAKALSHSSVLILLNLSSAFDTVNHQILLSTLAKLGIADSALTW